MPNAGYRLNLPGPIELEGDQFSEPEGVLAGGDILIVRAAGDMPFLSCNSQGKYCRTADGLEMLVFATTPSLLRYDISLPPFDHPHTVRRAPDIVAAGQKASCFLIEGEGQTGEPYAMTQCYSDDGLLLRAVFDGAEALDALEVSLDVSESDLEPPFEFVASVYDAD
ncbi:MAG: hypothetical protein WEB52_02760 [Dehalococcoidia bacterium]